MNLYSLYQTFIFEKSYRYIDDLIIINGEEDVEEHLHNIYLTFLKFEKSNNSNDNVNYLDLNIDTNQKMIKV